VVSRRRSGFRLLAARLGGPGRPGTRKGGTSAGWTSAGWSHVSAANLVLGQAQLPSPRQNKAPLTAPLTRPRAPRGATPYPLTVTPTLCQPVAPSGAGSAVGLRLGIPRVLSVARTVMLWLPGVAFPGQGYHSRQVVDRGHRGEGGPSASRRLSRRTSTFEMPRCGGPGPLRRITVWPAEMLPAPRLVDGVTRS